MLHAETTCKAIKDVIESLTSIETNGPDPRGKQNVVSKDWRLGENGDPLTID